jgi:hypothetical protein
LSSEKSPEIIETKLIILLKEILNQGIKEGGVGKTTSSNLLSFLNDWDINKVLFEIASSKESNEEKIENDSDSEEDITEIGGLITYQNDYEKKEDKSKIKSFIESYFKAFAMAEAQFIKFDWPGLSSGQMAMFNIFSRFHYLRSLDVNNMNLNSPNKEPVGEWKLSKNIIIFIDEGELYFHPQWQKEFLATLLKGLKYIFYYSDKPETNEDKTSRNIQLVASVQMKSEF